MNVEIRELGPELVDDYLAFFDRDAFADNPEWAGCYCMYFQFSGSRQAWSETTAEENREAVRQRIVSGQAQGLLAYVDGRPVAWCQAALPASVPSLERNIGHTVQDRERVGVITCFVVAAPFRRKGVARRLLNAACDRFAEAGLAWAEAYPRRAQTDDAEQFPGPLPLYLEAGFQEVGTTEQRVVVRRALR